MPPAASRSPNTVESRKSRVQSFDRSCSQIALFPQLLDNTS
jgi:hypothetical protein